MFSKVCGIQCDLLDAIGLIMFISQAKTRKEEIGRFNRAKDDKEFAKVLRARSLGPEHLETQAQLRRAIRVCLLLFLSTCRVITGMYR